MYYGARGVVGPVKPTYWSGSLESFIREPVKGYGRLLAEMP